MLVAQHYAAFRQRYVIGWTTDDENTKAKGAASRLWTFGSDGDPDAVKVGEFEQTDLSGYLKSREATFEHLGVLSQVPPHNLVGQMVNLSAEALVAAESSSRRKINELETSLGESTEQLFELISIGMGIDPPESPEVRWRDTEARSFAATVDALGKLSSLLAVPPRALWERIPDVTEEELARWTSIAEQGGELDMLLRQLVDGQTHPVSPRRRCSRWLPHHLPKRIASPRTVSALRPSPNCWQCGTSSTSKTWTLRRASGCRQPSRSSVPNTASPPNSLPATCGRSVPPSSAPSPALSRPSQSSTRDGSPRR